MAMKTLLNPACYFKGSRWTLQATKMDGNFVSVMIKLVNAFEPAISSCSN